LIFASIGRGRRELTPAQQAERREYEALAMQTLREALAEGYEDVANISTDGDLEALRSRDDFQELLRGAKPRVEAVCR
jgi:hypothetical protein